MTEVNSTDSKHATEQKTHDAINQTQEMQGDMQKNHTKTTIAMIRNSNIITS